MKQIVLSSLLASILITGLQAENIKDINKESVKVETKKIKNADYDKSKEAFQSLILATEALAALEKKDTKEAKDKIEKALGKLEVTLADPKAPKLLPFDFKVKVSEYLGTKKDVEKDISLVKKMLNEGKVQEARVLLNTLVSEIDLYIVNLPLASYPDALKLAGKYIADNKIEEAKEVLGVALSSFITIKEITPIPLVKSVKMLDMASKKDKESEKYLAEAKKQLEMSKALGYVSDSDITYKVLSEKIDEISSKLRKEDTKGLFDKLKEDIKEFISKIKKEKSS